MLCLLTDLYNNILIQHNAMDHIKLYYTDIRILYGYIYIYIYIYIHCACLSRGAGLYRSDLDIGSSAVYPVIFFFLCIFYPFDNTNDDSWVE